ncbi:sensor protein RprX [Microscilla marina ATCC 23134]|uniref:histidine kinase n=2 Tax=Microscilla marina TaxID=1027 RepID=A1ZT92_MICM2|nr:sensor protein RprX [Microscilla marina ATCC 23134]
MVASTELKNVKYPKKQLLSPYFVSNIQRTGAYMKTRKKLNYIIFLMSVALIGLIGLQIYWVNTSLKIKKERFNQDVHQALSNLVRKLEKRETAYAVGNRFFNTKGSRYPHPQQFYNIIASGNRKFNVLRKSKTKKNHSKVELQHSWTLSEGGEDTTFTLNVSSKSNPRLKQILHPQEVTVVNDDSSKKVHVKASSVMLVIDELLSKRKPLHQRISQELLDSLLHIELLSKGIDIPYRFNVVTQQNGQYRYVFHPQKPIQYSNPQQALSQVNYATILFPNDISPQPNKLLVDFPAENTFVIKQMWTVLASAFVFIALIIFCFTFAVNTILKQKKMSDMTKDFINNMTHEFKTPIATVSLACQAMQDPDIQQLPGQVNRYMGMIKEENDRLGQQVEKVLQIARLDREDFKLNISEVDVHQSIAKAVRNIQIQVEKRGGMLHTALNAEQACIYADEIHLTNMIINLLDNANKYSPDHPEITIETQSNERGIRVMISDKGQGISKEVINKVFDKFYRVPTGNIHDVKGFGLGLSYVKTMVDAHQGEIQVKSEPAKGSTFTLFFPYMAHSA